jgi:3-oxoacyl-[acyl-carrier protein] reductase
VTKFLGQRDSVYCLTNYT